MGPGEVEMGEARTGAGSETEAGAGVKTKTGAS